MRATYRLVSKVVFVLRWLHPFVNKAQLVAFIPVPNTAHLVVHFRNDADGSPASNNLFFHNTAGWDAGSLSAMLDFMEPWLVANWAPLAIDEWRAVKLVIRDLEFEDSFVVERSVDIEGDIAGDAMPNNVTIAVSFRTGLAGPNKRGRNFFVGLPRAAIVDNNIQTAAVGNIVNAYTTLITDLPGDVAGVSWVVCSRYEEGEPLPSGLVYPVTTVIITDLQVDTLRRRMP